MQTNPYDVDTSDIELAYAGFDAGFYCFRVRLAGASGMASTMMQMELSQWLFDNVEPGKWFMGNSFPYKDHPAVKLFNDKSTDTFILLEQMVDVVRFERDFTVNGLTPSMLVP